MSSATTTKIPVPWWQWWPLLIGPAGMVIAYAIHRVGPWAESLTGPESHDALKPALERLAIVVTATGVAGAVVHLLVTRSRFHLLLAGLAIMVLFREFHWPWTTKGVYIVLGLLAILAFVWRRDVLPYVDCSRALRVWPLATALTYVLSQAIARRIFRGIVPDEGAVYSNVEEFVENVSHAMLLVTTLVGPWRFSSSSFTAHGSEPRSPEP